MTLDELETPLGDMVKKSIEVVYRPWEEKSENMKYKDEKKQQEKLENEGLFAAEDSSGDDTEEADPKQLADLSEDISEK